MGFTDQALSLNLGLPSTTTTATHRTRRLATTTEPTDYEPSLTLSLSGGPHGGGEHHHKASGRDQDPASAAAAAAASVISEAHNRQYPHAAGVYYYSGGGSQYSSPRGSGVSSISGVKRERDQIGSEEVEEAAAAADGDRSVLSGSRGLLQGATGGSDEDDEETIATHSNNSQGHSHSVVGVRKKLRLSKDQSAMLEESFKQHSTLNPKQKQALANQLNLRPRQVEVWFQNRRARTKLKQTEVDCEFLKKCCETLTEENRRLQKEVQELRAIKQLQLQYAVTAATSSSSAAAQRPPAYIHHQLQPTAAAATALTMCPSCERVCRTSGGGNMESTTGTKSTAGFTTKSHFVYAFAAAGAANSSAGTAC